MATATLADMFVLNIYIYIYLKSIYIVFKKQCESINC